jgi:alanyl-tRNA synthetase
MGPIASDQSHTDCAFGCDCGRYVEIWNLVFMQFNRIGEGTQYFDEEAKAQRYPSYRLEPLPKPSIDTGAGLERITSVLQGVVSNYDTDLFIPLVKRAAELTSTALKKEIEKEAHARSAASLRVIADHSRAATFLISDGVIPSNEGRGYTLRKIIRRAITHGRLLGQNKPFLNQMVFAVRDVMQDAYPELRETAERVSKAVLAEETRFAHTLSFALKELDAAIVESAERASRAVQSHVAEGSAPIPSVPVLSGDRAFHIYQTYGAPLDFIKDVARDRGLIFNQDEFKAELAKERDRARASWKGAAKQTANPEYQKLPASDFEGYHRTRSDSAEVLALLENGHGVEELKPGEQGEAILDHTPFYAEAGGQVGDRGWLYSDDHNTVVAEVTGTYYPIQGVRAHKIVAKQPIHVADKVDAVVDTGIREATMRNHTATHLLHAGLREVLGKHVKQAGSLVAPNHLRFDFSHFTAVEDEELQDIEDLINKEVLRNIKVETIENVPIDVAVNEYHAMALFGEKYGDKVRVIRIGDFSTELCGGTHTAATGEIGLIKILKEGSVSSGLRRVEAVTGEGSLHHFRKDHQLENVVAALAGHAEADSPADALKLELDKKDAEIKRLARELDQARMKSASSSVASTAEKIKEVKGVKVLAHRVDNLERPQMRTLVDQLRDKVGSGVVVLGSATDGRVALIVGVTKDLTGRIQAGKIIGQVAQKVGGKGGGRPDMAEAGGDKPEALDAALNDVYNVVESML